MSVLTVAAVSARMLSEASVRDGYRVHALDLFGDADTRRAAAQWHPIGVPGALQIDAERVLEALRDLARRPGADVIGWIAGSGFEGMPDLLADGARLLPLLGTPAESVRRVRDPGAFFAALDARGISHPPVSPAAPADPAGWLRKDAHGCGGWHIRHAAEAMVAGASIDPHLYFQREVSGISMSATFIANGSDAMLLGVNELIVRPLGSRPHVFAGCIGPVPVPPELACRIEDAARALSSEFGLRGWCSLDFMRDVDDVHVLEVNPRPPASLELYAQRGLVDAQLRACLQAELPRHGAFAFSGVTGHEILYARRALTLSPEGAQYLSQRTDTHDLPAAGAHFAAFEPICSVSVSANTNVESNAAHVRALLSAACEDVMHTLEMETP